jgi:hypothetical protein
MASRKDKSPHSYPIAFLVVYTKPAPKGWPSWSKQCRHKPGQRSPSIVFIANT